MLLSVIKGIGYVVFSLIVFVGIVEFWNSCMDNKILIRENAELKIENAAYENKNSKYEIEKQKQKMMAQAMIICYRISEWESRYYAQMFCDFSQKYNTPWEIYAATIQIESRFRADVLSIKKAKGIMQVMEATGKIVSDKIGIHFVKEQSLWNELLNVPIGCTYLSDMIKEKGLEGGVKSYIGGPDFSLISGKSKNDIDRYCNDVTTEYTKMCYIYKGIVAEFLHSNDIDTIYVK